MSDTGPAKLPGFQPLRTTDKALAVWSQAVTEHLEVRAGARGNPLEKAVVQRDMVGITKVVDGLTEQKASSKTDIAIDIGSGVMVNIPIEKIVDGLLANQRFKNATASTPAATALTDTSGDSASMKQIESTLASRIDGLVAGKKSLADGAFYISNPTVPLSSGIPTVAGAVTPVVVMHPDALALKSDVVIFNDITIKEMMIDLYKMIYAGQKPVSLNRDSIIFNQQTIADWATEMYAIRVLAQRAQARADEAYQRALLP